VKQERLALMVHLVVVAEVGLAREVPSVLQVQQAQWVLLVYKERRDYKEFKEKKARRVKQELKEFKEFKEFKEKKARRVKQELKDYKDHQAQGDQEVLLSPTQLAQIIKKLRG